MKATNWKITLAILSSGAVLMSAGYTMLVPFLPMYLIRELGVAASDVNWWSGAIFSITFLFSGIMAPVWGALADRTSPRMMAIRAAVCLAATYMLGGLVQGPWQLFFVRVFQGFSAGLWPAMLAIMSTQMPRERTGFSLGLLQAGCTAGGVLGPLVGGILAETIGMRWTFGVAGIGLAIVSLLLIFVVRDGSRPKARSQAQGGRASSLLKKPVIQRMLFAACLTQMTVLLVQPVLPMYIAELHGSMDKVVLISGIVFSIVGISGIFASPLWGIAGQRAGFRPTLYLALFLSGIFGTVQAIPHDLMAFTAWRFVGGVTFAGIFPAINAILAQNSDISERGKVYSYSYAVQQFGSILGPMLGGALAVWWGNQVAIGAAGVLLFPVVLLLYVCRPKEPDASVGVPVEIEEEAGAGDPKDESRA